MDELIYRCMTKATTAEGDQMQYGRNWVVARRAMLKVYRDRLECGDWSIPYDSIVDASLISIRSMFIPGYVLRVATGETVYHFGLNGGAFWRSELPFEARREVGKLGYSTFSIALRLVAAVVVGFLVWQRLA